MNSIIFFYWQEHISFGKSLINRPHRIAYKPYPDDFAYKVSRGHLKTLTGNSRGYDLDFTIPD